MALNTAEGAGASPARPLLVLGLETSCDETAAAVVARDGPADGRILSNVVRSQWAEHRPYGGVVPEIAARAHVECLDEIVAAALADAGLGLRDLSAVAAPLAAPLDWLLGPQLRPSSRPAQTDTATSLSG